MDGLSGGSVDSVDRKPRTAGRRVNLTQALMPPRRAPTSQALSRRALFVCRPPVDRSTGPPARGPPSTLCVIVAVIATSPAAARLTKIGFVQCDGETRALRGARKPAPRCGRRCRTTDRGSAPAREDSSRRCGGGAGRRAADRNRRISRRAIPSRRASAPITARSKNSASCSLNRSQLIVGCVIDSVPPATGAERGAAAPWWLPMSRRASRRSLRACSLRRRATRTRVARPVAVW